MSHTLFERPGAIPSTPKNQQQPQPKREQTPKRPAETDTDITISTTPAKKQKRAPLAPSNHKPIATKPPTPQQTHGHTHARTRTRHAPVPLNNPSAFSEAELAAEICPILPTDRTRLTAAREQGLSARVVYGTASEGWVTALQRDRIEAGRWWMVPRVGVEFERPRWRDGEGEGGMGELEDREVSPGFGSFGEWREGGVEQ